jgi:hypothetical protein
VHDRFAEVINHCCDGESATEPFVQLVSVIVGS